MDHQPTSSSFSPLFARNAEAQPFEMLFGESPRASAFTLLDPKTPGSEGDAPHAGPTTANEQLQQAREQAAQIVAEAHAEAETLAQEEIAVAVETVRRDQTEAFATAARELLARLQEQSEAHLQNLEKEAAGLVVQIARRVLCERFEADAAAIVPVVREALRPLAEERRLRVIVAPQHQPAVHAAYQELTQVLREEAHLEIVISDAAPAYGCVVHGDGGSIDARLDTRLRMLDEAAAEALVSATAA